MMSRLWFASATRRRLVAVALALLPLAAVAAGSRDAESSPAGSTSPTRSGVADISGRWTGSSSWEQNDVDAIGSITMAFSQDGGRVTGTLVSTSPADQGWAGTVSGTVAGTAPDTQFVGTIELRAPSRTGDARCVGQAVFSGRSVADSLRWETSQLRLDSNDDREPDPACRARLRRVVLIMRRG